MWSHDRYATWYSRFLFLPLFTWFFYLCAVVCLWLSQLKGLLTAVNEYQTTETLKPELISSNALHYKGQGCLVSLLNTSWKLQKWTVCWRYNNLNLMADFYFMRLIRNINNSYISVTCLLVIICSFWPQSNFLFTEVASSCG